MSTQFRNLTDEDLIHRIAVKQDREAFSTLFQRYKHLALGVGLKYLASEDAAKDVAQAAFMKVWTDAHRFQIQRFKPWFYQVVKNLCLMTLRKKEPQAVLSSENEMEIVEWEDNLHLKLKEEALLVQLNLCLRELKKEQQACIQHFYIEEKSYQEVALLTGYSNKEVKSHIQNGKRNLKICLLKTLKSA